MFEGFRKEAGKKSYTSKAAIAGAAMLGAVSAAEAKNNPDNAHIRPLVGVEEINPNSNSEEIKTDFAREFEVAIGRLKERFGEEKLNGIMFNGSFRINASEVIMSVALPDNNGTPVREYTFAWKIGDGLTDVLAEFLISEGFLSAN
ncbi:hypothetical protein H6783_02435 [Candidatus Nomurabacteria bacterium]|nr:hypothetical protein [Candidatus Nomurabacteria bacterium]